MKNDTLTLARETPKIFQKYLDEKTCASEKADLKTKLIETFLVLTTSAETTYRFNPRESEKYFCWIEAIGAIIRDTNQDD